MSTVESILREGLAGKLDMPVRNLTIPVMDQIAAKANQTKDTELRKAGLRMNHRLTAGDVRHVLRAADFDAKSKAGAK
jgi:hypothetical protein